MEVMELMVMRLMEWQQIDFDPADLVDSCEKAHVPSSDTNKP